MKDRADDAGNICIRIRRDLSKPRVCMQIYTDSHRCINFDKANNALLHPDTQRIREKSRVANFP